LSHRCQTCRSMCTPHVNCKHTAPTYKRHDCHTYIKVHIACCIRPSMHMPHVAMGYTDPKSTSHMLNPKPTCPIRSPPAQSETHMLNPKPVGPQPTCPTRFCRPSIHMPNPKSDVNERCEVGKHTAWTVIIKLRSPCIHKNL
jgi:hypothetical protein